MKNCGRRGRKLQKKLDKEGRKDREKERALQNEQRERDQALKRILPRMRRWCKLSQMGVIFVEDKRIQGIADVFDRETYLSVDGPVVMSNWGGELRVMRTIPWKDVVLFRLKHLAQIKKFQILKPKNDMLILAEAIAGFHDDL